MPVELHDAHDARARMTRTAAVRVRRTLRALHVTGTTPVLAAGLRPNRLLIPSP